MKSWLVGGSRRGNAGPACTACPGLLFGFAIQWLAGSGCARLEEPVQVLWCRVRRQSRPATVRGEAGKCYPSRLPRAPEMQR